MQLSKVNLTAISQFSEVILPANNLFELEEKIIQFGTGVLLRGLIDFIIDTANKNNQFNGRVLVVKSTETELPNAFKSQQNLYTIAIKGVQNKKIISTYHCVAAISRVLSAKDEWQQILLAANNPALQVVVSNTTESGLVLVLENIFQNPPSSFPAKLLSFLYQRFLYFNGDINKGLVIIPTELLPDNGVILLDIILQLATYNQLNPRFIEWIKTANYFCSSLVDRIVPGKPAATELAKMETEMGYSDDLLIVAEPYYLWAIETGNEKVKSILSFAINNKNVVLTGNIQKYRELKLRLLNGTHTLACGLAYLSGFKTVKQAMENILFNDYVFQLMHKNILPVLDDSLISKEEGIAFAAAVMDRFSNNFIEHNWLSISSDYTAKTETRIVPLLENFLNQYHKTPAFVALGMAAYILFMKSFQKLDGSFWGRLPLNEYPIKDKMAGTYFKAWQLKDPCLVVEYVWLQVPLYSKINCHKFKIELLKWLQFLTIHPVKDALAKVLQEGV